MNTWESILRFTRPEEPYWQLLLNICFPILGILFFGWSLRGVYYLFFSEVMFLGIFTGLKLLFCIGDGGIGDRLANLLFFTGIYVFLFLLVMGVVAHFFDLSRPESASVPDRGILWALVASYAVDFVHAFLWQGKYKRAGYSRVLQEETVLRMFGLFFILLAIVGPVLLLTPSSQDNVVVAVGIVLAKNLVDFFMVMGSRHLPGAKVRRRRTRSSEF